MSHGPLWLPTNKSWDALWSKFDFFSKKFIFSSIFIFSHRNKFWFKLYNFFPVKNEVSYFTMLETTWQTRQYFGAFQASKVRLRTKNSLFAVKSKKCSVSARFESKCNFDIGIKKNTPCLMNHLGLN